MYKSILWTKNIDKLEIKLKNKTENCQKAYLERIWEQK